MKHIYYIIADGETMIHDRFGALVRVKRLKVCGPQQVNGPIPCRDLATGETVWVQKSALRKAK